MKRVIIEALTYPRMAMLSHMDAESCPLQLRFDSDHPECVLCSGANECHWLTRHNEFQILNDKPITQLYEALLFCVEFIGSRMTVDGHNVGRCACEGCSWIRDARHLTIQIGEELSSAV